MAQTSNAVSHRRVVTGTASDGRSIIAQDSACPHRLETSPGGITLTEMWVTEAAPADQAASFDGAARPVSIAPPPGGTVFRLVEYPPDSAYLDGWDPASAWEAMGGEPLPEPARAQRAAARHPAFHQTETVDYIVVVEGEIWALMEDGEVLLRQGDCVVQRGTNHAWSNRTERRCVLAAVLVDSSASGRA